MSKNEKKSVMFVLIFKDDGLIDEAYKLHQKYNLSYKKNIKGNILLVGEKDKCLELLDECSRELFFNLIKFTVFKDFF